MKEKINTEGNTVIGTVINIEEKNRKAISQGAVNGGAVKSHVQRNS